MGSRNGSVKDGAHQQGEVGIAGLAVGVAVPVHGDHRVGGAGGLQGDVAAGTDAEGPDAVIKSGGEVLQLRLVQHVGQLRQDGAGHLHANADIHRVVAHGQLQPAGFVDQPVRPFPAGGQDKVVALYAFTVGRLYALDAVLVRQDGGGGLLHPDVHRRREVVLHGPQDGVAVLRPQVAQGHRDQVQLHQAGAPRQLLHLLADAPERVRGPEAKVDAVHVADELAGGRLPQVLDQTPADVRRKGHLAVAVGAGPAQAAHHVAGRAGYAVGGPVGRPGSGACPGPCPSPGAGPSGWPPGKAPARRRCRPGRPPL